MPNMTLSIDEELHDAIKSHPEIKWCAIARKAMKEYADTLVVLERIAAKSKLTEKDVEELEPSIAKRHEI